MVEKMIQEELAYYVAYYQVYWKPYIDEVKYFFLYHKILIINWLKNLFKKIIYFLTFF